MYIVFVGFYDYVFDFYMMKLLLGEVLDVVFDVVDVMVMMIEDLVKFEVKDILVVNLLFLGCIFVLLILFLGNSLD